MRLNLTYCTKTVKWLTLNFSQVGEMIKHQLQLMPRENALIVDPLALDDELVVPELPAPESFKQDPLDFEDSPMVNALASKFLSIRLRVMSFTGGRRGWWLYQLSRAPYLQCVSQQEEEELEQRLESLSFGLIMGFH